MPLLPAFTGQSAFNQLLVLLTRTQITLVRFSPFLKTPMGTLDLLLWGVKHRWGPSLSDQRFKPATAPQQSGGLLKLPLPPPGSRNGNAMSLFPTQSSC